ncbi:hypothetical protein B0T26DRAFT_200272 [Lasiosphaeria miniovina]|uniref:Uncharacterized protein n=1 Tax=Lasiosphaeria miniovina TaxID=1954250 RepID=A0AA40AU58_9PEZI|nr:uncharacterized protein B0T26DRAFT_200272 [Lasiosphaeria miniovina]KAK0722049.1 hypothetical protein B0T26DRAFT_200272 [Lasiosphaeria miniovina]
MVVSIKEHFCRDFPALQVPDYSTRCFSQGIHLGRKRRMLLGPSWTCRPKEKMAVGISDQTPPHFISDIARNALSPRQPLLNFDIIFQSDNCPETRTGNPRLDRGHPPESCHGRATAHPHLSNPHLSRPRNRARVGLPPPPPPQRKGPGSSNKCQAVLERTRQLQIGPRSETTKQEINSMRRAANHTDGIGGLLVNISALASWSHHANAWSSLVSLPICVVPYASVDNCQGKIPAAGLCHRVSVSRLAALKLCMPRT